MTTTYNFSHYIIAEPFPGHVQTLYDPEADRVAYDDRGLTFTEYQQENAQNIRVVDEAELSAIWRDHTKSLITDPTPIDKKTWNYYLEVLPPCRWTSEQGVELFHVSERLTDNLVTWCARVGSQYFTFVDRDRRPTVELRAKVSGALS